MSYRGNKVGVTDRQTNRQTNTSKNNTSYHFVIEVVGGAGMAQLVERQMCHLSVGVRFPAGAAFSP